MRHEDVVRAGAPGLPEGQFYRDVQRDDSYTVEVRELGEYYGSKVIGQASSMPDETDADLPAVARRAEKRSHGTV